MSLFYSKDCSPDLIGHVGYLSDPHKTRSQIGYVFIWGGTVISWRYTKQSIIATSSNHAEIITIHEIRSTDNVTDLFTKSSPIATFKKMLHKIEMQRSRMFSLRGVNTHCTLFSLRGFVPLGFPCSVTIMACQILLVLFKQQLRLFIFRPGLLSEVCAVFADLHWNVANTAIWTRNARAAAVVHVVDDVTDCAIEDPKRLAAIKKLLRNVLYGNNDLKTAQMTLSSPGFTHRERKLHQIMFADRDYIKVRRAEQGKVEDLKSGPCMTIYDCSEKDYNVITMRSRDRPKLLFDIVCSLTDMQYVVFHGVVHTGKWKLISFLQGPELELCTEDRLGFLSDITRIFRENSLCAERAEISIEGGKPKVIFSFTDVTGNPMDQKTVDSIREQVDSIPVLHF
ncbi:ACT domain-containing protein ACR6 [Capsicum annuum]|nr:ACT domain-containing protein ACR6 [Capsicum annuum]